MELKSKTTSEIFNSKNIDIDKIISIGKIAMKLFDIFKKKKKMTIKELYAPVLDEMWVCTFNFRPWDESGNKVIFKKVVIVSAEATRDGIWVMSGERYPFHENDETICGYIDKFDCGRYWTGFFETEEEAKKAFNDLMIKWCDVMKSNIVDI